MKNVLFTRLEKNSHFSHIVHNIKKNEKINPTFEQKMQNGLFTRLEKIALLSHCPQY